ncbi:MAG: protein kinase [Chloroflexi bacterium]|nr:protein kinase [Chloroflexota bacterium]
MGKVFQATDRLTGSTIAIKQVTTKVDKLLFNSQDTSSDAHVALAREFRVLSSLRHPNIISVLNYGFEERLPYLAMEFLDDAQTVVAASRHKPLKYKVNLLIQLLQSLVYLHRRGIFHRDLKPANVMVTADDTVKVLDFGLATEPSQETDIVGTLPYMAPELFRENVYDVRSDLYSVGVIAYEMLAGKYPFFADSSTALIRSILLETPNADVLNEAIYNAIVLEEDSDVANLLKDAADTFILEDRQLPDTGGEGVPVPEPVRPIGALTHIVLRLLEKDPKLRYPDAQSVINDIYRGMGEAPPSESVEIRESFLQAARFVGRSAEVQKLRSATEMMVNEKRGGTWLIAGESGVGKSRLTDEVYAYTVTRGVEVLRGQARREGQIPYQVWRDVLRWLVIAVDVTDFEASILKTLLPDIGTLLGRDIPDSGDVDPAAAQERLLNTVETLFTRFADRPLMLVMEDMHWAGSESLTLFDRLQKLVETQPLLLLATYRDDERPDLPTQIPDSHVLKLNRLESEHIAELSGSMLGPTGTQPHIVEFLQRETEGNVFFLVEIMRSLAQEAGQLENISQMELPETVSAGGIEAIIQQRLSYVAPENRLLLDIAAVMGRQLDLDVLRELTNGLALEYWLNSISNAAIIEVREGDWRFSHDKIRAGIEDRIEDAQSKTLHSQIGQAIESAYPDGETQAARLAYHWQQAEIPGSEAYYRMVAGEQAMSSGAYDEALEFLNRASELRQHNAHLDLVKLERLLGETHHGLGQLDESQEHLVQSLALQSEYVPQSKAALGVKLAREMTRQMLHRALPRLLVNNSTPMTNNAIEKIRALDRLSELYYHDDRSFWTLYAGFRAVNVAESFAPSPERARSYGTMSIIAGTTPMRNWLAKNYSKWAFELAEELDPQRSLGYIGMATGVYRSGVGLWDAIYKDAGRSVTIAEQLGDYRLLGQSLIVIGTALHYEGKFMESLAEYRRLHQVGLRSGDLQLQAWGLGGIGQNELRLGRLDEAIQHLEESLVLYNQVADSSLQLRSVGLLLLAHMRKGDIGKAHAAADDARELIAGQPLPSSNGRFEGYRGVTELTMYEWERDVKNPEKKKAVKKAMSGMRRFINVFPFGDPTHSCWEGTFYFLNGNLEKAHQSWASAIDDSTALSMPFESAMGYFERGRLTRNVADLQEARNIFEQLGAELDVQRVDAVQIKK